MTRRLVSCSRERLFLFKYLVAADSSNLWKKSGLCCFLTGGVVECFAYKYAAQGWLNVQFEKIVRIGDKLVSVDRAKRLLERVFRAEGRGLSQQEVARRLSLDRTFISRLEAIGEIRKGKRVAVIGFPVKNKDELVKICQDLGAGVFLADDQTRNAGSWSTREAST